MVSREELESMGMSKEEAKLMGIPIAGKKQDWEISNSDWEGVLEEEEDGDEENIDEEMCLEESDDDVMSDGFGSGEDFEEGEEEEAGEYDEVEDSSMWKVMFPT